MLISKYEYFIWEKVGFDSLAVRFSIPPGSDSKQSSLWCLPVFAGNKKSKDKKAMLGNQAKKTAKTTKSQKYSKSPFGGPYISKPPKPPRKPLSIKLRLFKGIERLGSKQCISVVTDNEGPSVSEQYHGAARRSDSYRRSCSDLDRWDCVCLVVT